MISIKVLIMFKLKMKFLNLVTKITSVQIIFLLFYGPQINFVIFLNISSISFRRWRAPTWTKVRHVCTCYMGLLIILHLFCSPPPNMSVLYLSPADLLPSVGDSSTLLASLSLFGFTMLCSARHRGSLTLPRVSFKLLPGNDPKSPKICCQLFTFFMLSQGFTAVFYWFLNREVTLFFAKMHLHNIKICQMISNKKHDTLLIA